MRKFIITISNILSALIFFKAMVLSSVVLYAGESVSKKGFGLSESKGFSERHLKLLQVGWYYNWGLDTKLKTELEFVPMVFSERSLNKLKSYEFLLGYNEPDNSKQSNMTVDKALKNWKVLDKATKQLGSPATASNPLKENSWLTNFMNKNPKVDFIAVHWYKGVDPEKFKSDIQEIIDLYKLPVWITEFAPQTAADSKSNPTKYTVKEIVNFVKVTTYWMNSNPMVQRYAWHDSRSGNTAIFTDAGDLTVVGRAYSAIN